MEFKNLPDRTTPLKAENINKLNDVHVGVTAPTMNEKMWVEYSKNLLDYKKIYSSSSSVVVTQITNGVNVKVTNSYAAKITIENLERNSDYYLSYITEVISGGVKSVAIFAGTGTSTELARFDNGTGGKFNTGSNVTVNIWFYGALGGSGEVKFTNIMLNDGSLASQYEPYVDANIKVNMNGKYNTAVKHAISYQAVVTYPSAFDRIDVNRVEKYGKMVHVVFRGHLNSQIASNTNIISNIPTSAIGTEEAGYMMYTSTGQYGDGTKTPYWAYVISNSLRGSALPSGVWLHINFTYIAE